MGEENNIKEMVSDKFSTPASANISKSWPLRVWLILITFASSLVCVLTAVLTIFTFFALFFSFDDPDTTMGDFLTMEGWLLGTVTILIALTLVGIGGGWAAYRQGRTNLSLVTSLLALIPICLCMVSIAFFFATSSSIFPIDVSIGR